MMWAHKTQVMIGVAVLGLGCTCAWAGLGGHADSVQADGAHMKAQVHGVPSTGNYSVDTLTLPSGTVVREYLSPSGTVFGVSWHGPTMPDLRQIFGSYFTQFVAASQVAQHNASTHHHFAITAPDLIVQSSGHMRDYFGRAWVPSLLPANVTPADIQ